MHLLSASMALAGPLQSSWYHLLYLPAQTMSMDEAMSRGTGLMLFLKSTNVSMRYTGDDAEGAIAAAVRRHVEAWKLELPLLSGYMDAINRGMAITKKGLNLATAANADDPEERTMDDIRSNKQAVLAPLAKAPGARTVGGKQKDKDRTPTTRGGTDLVALRKSIDMEAAALSKAVERSKRMRDDDIAAAAVKAKTPNTKRAKRAAGAAGPGIKGKERDTGGDGQPDAEE